MKRNFHVWCEVGENLKITSKSYLSLWYQIAKKKKLTGVKKVAYIAGYVAVNSINPFKVAKKVVKCVKAVKKVRRVAKTYKRYKKAKVVYKKAKKIAKATYRKSKKVVRKSTKKVYKGYLKTKCKVTKKGCFVEGTLVLTENGLIPIENIEVGDYVWSENPKTGEIELKEVLNTFEKQVDTIVTITVNGENIETTEAHLFYVENVGWVPASMLREGDILSLEDGRNVPIESIETTTYNHYINVYNFEVDDFHTYYVSNISVLTHNQTPCQKLKRMDTGKKYWNKKVKYGGSTVYQRDDLIDPKKIDGKGRSNLQRMQAGIAPLGKDGKSINLHHLIQMDGGNLAEILSSKHSENKVMIHVNPNTIPSGINRKEFAKYTRKYWRRRAKDFD